MHPFPHIYRVTAAVQGDGDIALESPGLPTLVTNTPAEFDGPGDRWSPETLFVAAIADCFLLTFRGIARASRMAWESIECDVTGKLERPERVSRFTEVMIRARLRIPPGTSDDQARRILTRAEETCLITRSLTAATHLELEVLMAEPAPADSV
jgi:organic hydroperoxide reductase OsmC/OhrA